MAKCYFFRPEDIRPCRRKIAVESETIVEPARGTSAALEREDNLRENEYLRDTPPGCRARLLQNFRKYSIFPPANAPVNKRNKHLALKKKEKSNQKIHTKN